jgi:hypothetical protein
MNNGFIVVYRSLLEWEWYSDANTTRLFLHCLLRANHKDKAWQGITIERGSFVTSYQHLALDLGLTVSQIRTSLDKLKITGEIAHKSHSKYGIITIKNYDKYQDNRSQDSTQIANKSQSNRNKQQGNKETKKQDIKEYGTHIRMEQNEYEKLVERFGQVLTDKYIEKVDLYIGSTGKKYKSHYMTVISWLNRDIEKDPKLTYTWQEELKAEQDKFDNRSYEPKRSAEEAKRKLDEL